MNGQSGNALWFILLAIALMGILTAVMTRSSGTDSDTGDYEQNQIAASEILRYAKSIENAVQTLIARGCSENTISFWHDSDGNGTENGSDDYYNADSPTDHSCHIFEPEGGGLTWNTVKPKYLDASHSSEVNYGDWFITGSVHLNGFGNEAPATPACGTNCTELMMSLNYIRLDLCNGVNKISNHGASDGSPVVDEGGSIGEAGHTKFTGSYLGVHEMGTADPATDNYDGKGTGCIETDTTPASGSYTFYHVLHAR